MEDEEKEKVEVPEIKWHRLEVSKGTGGDWCGAVRIDALQLPNGSVVPVVLRKLPQHSCDATVWSPCMEEAKVLRALSGLPGVPKLYGVTESPPYAILSSLYKGEMLDDLRRRGRVRLCLVALQEVCLVLRDLHKRGYYHGDVHAGEILVRYTKAMCCMLVTLVNFGKAGRLTEGTKEKDADEKGVCILVKRILLSMEKKDDPWIYNNRMKFLIDMEDAHSLDMIHHMLYDFSVDRYSWAHFLSERC